MDYQTKLEHITTLNRFEDMWNVRYQHGPFYDSLIGVLDNYRAVISEPSEPETEQPATVAVEQLTSAINDLTELYSRMRRTVDNLADTVQAIRNME